jgi:hypothetical protein
VARLWDGQPRNQVSISGEGQEIFFLFLSVQTGSRSHPASYISGERPPGHEADELHLNLVPKLGMRGAISPLPHTSLWYGF